MILEEQGERLHEETIPIKAAEIQTERKTRVIKMSGISGERRIFKAILQNIISDGKRGI